MDGLLPKMLSKHYLLLLFACFLLIFLKIRERSKKKHKEIFVSQSEKLWNCWLWNCFFATDKIKFSQRVRCLIEWASNSKNNVPSFILEKIEKLREKSTSFTKAYDFPKAPRTTNRVDGLMRPMEKYLFTNQHEETQFFDF